MKNPKKQQKELWEKEKEQLKKDLQHRQKIVKKNPVNIRFGKQATQHIPITKTHSAKLPDDYLKRQIGLL